MYYVKKGSYVSVIKLWSVCVTHIWQDWFYSGNVSVNVTKELSALKVYQAEKILKHHLPLLSNSY